MNPEVQAALTGIFQLIVPELILAAAACILFLGSTFRASRNLWAGTAMLALFGAVVALWFTPMPGTAESVTGGTWLMEVWHRLGSPRATLPQSSTGEWTIYASALAVDRLAILTKAIALLSGLLLVLVSWKLIPNHIAGEYYACLVLIIAGVCLTGSANELVTLFLALELISIPTYILMYLPRSDQQAQEAAMKYFLLSVLSSALVLFGFSYLYGLAGTTNLSALFETLRSAPSQDLPLIAMVAMVMIMAGLGFRITAVPFHFYAPDVYQGTPTPVAAMLAYVPKVAGFVALIRLLGIVNAGQSDTGLALGDQMPMVLWILAAVTMTLGNVLALLQDNIKRMLAYSSVAHAGYMLMGLAVTPILFSEGLPGGVDAVLFYLMAYGAMTVGAFAVLAHLSTPDRPVEHVDDLAGLSRSHPVVAMLMGLFLLSLIGVPLTAGFSGKLLLFMGAMLPTPQSYPMMFRILALIGMLNAAIGAWYYLRILAIIYLRSPIKPLAAARAPAGWIALGICGLITLALGIYPKPFSQWTMQARGASATSPVASRDR